MEESTARIAAAKSFCFIAYYLMSVWPYCQEPYGSFPMSQNFTWYGPGWPFVARWAPIGVEIGPFIYSTSSAAECASPKPAFTVM